MSDPIPVRDELPTETEIYILPTGEIVVADLPAELAATLDPALLSRAQQLDHSDHDDTQRDSTVCDG